VLGVALWPLRLHGAVRPHGSLASDRYNKECLALPNGSVRRAARYLSRRLGLRLCDCPCLLVSYTTLAGRVFAPLASVRAAA
jgi:hypothetical protein